jgi:hypothetical protein
MTRRAWVVTLWTCFLIDAAVGGWSSAGEADPLADADAWIVAVALVAPLLVFPLVGAFAKGTPFLHPGLASWIDARARGGPGSYAAFLSAWRPALMLAVSGFVCATVFALRLAARDAAVHVYLGPAFYASAAAGAFALHVLQRRRGLPGA